MAWTRQKRLWAGSMGLLLPLAAAAGQHPSPLPPARQGLPSEPALAAGALPPLPPVRTEIFPLAGVRRGLKGVAYTVFEGVTPEPMGVEILGVLKDAIGPGQDMILGRLRGEKAEYTGVVAGMSGSPVYVDGRLVGALSYRIGVFSKEPICGITPIEQMLQVRDRQAGSAGMRAASTGRPPSAVATRAAVGGGPDGGGARLAQPWSSNGREVAAGGEIQPIETALAFGGFSRETVDRFGESFRAMGLTPAAGVGGAAAAGTRQPEPIIPGSAVSAVLVRGDLSISGTCTVTYVDPSQLLACGHPITQFGHVAMPMTKAEVVATLASPLNAFKIINTTETVGEFTEDRASAILGRFGESARMIPVSVQVLSSPASTQRAPIVAAEAGVSPEPSFRVASVQGGAPPSFEAPKGGPATPHGAAITGGMHFEVLDNRELTPQAMLMSVYQSLSGTNASENQMSYRMAGELTLKGQAPVHMEGIMAPTEAGSGAVSSALYVNDRFGRLYSNSMEQPEITGLHLRMEALPGRRSAVLEGARLGAYEVRPGEMLDVEATIRPYQAQAQVIRLKVKLPDTLARGQMRILVSDAAMVDKLTGSGTGGGTPGVIVLGGPAARPVALADAVAQMNRSHANDRVYVTLLDHTPQAGLESESLPAVPLSMANVLEPLRASQKVQLTGESAIEAGSAAVNYALAGSQVLTVDVR